ncbi:MAG: transcriptional repressor [Kiritimatiellae bacterium]|nr:transcriptional repressor [Kiritimatiellia bacterium]
MDWARDSARACRSMGVKATKQRMEIMREIARSTEHPDAVAICRRVRRRIPRLSLDTVYRTLRCLEDRGLISRVGPQQDRARFDPNTRGHHHFICTKCGHVGDFYSDDFDRLSPPSEVRAMGRMESVYVEFRGWCRACQDRKRKAQRNRRNAGNGLAPVVGVPEPYEHHAPSAEHRDGFHAAMDGVDRGRGERTVRDSRSLVLWRRRRGSAM